MWKSHDTCKIDRVVHRPATKPMKMSSLSKCSNWIVSLHRRIEQSLPFVCHCIRSVDKRTPPHNSRPRAWWQFRCWHISDYDESNEFPLENVSHWTRARSHDDCDRPNGSVALRRWIYFSIFHRKCKENLKVFYRQSTKRRAKLFKNERDRWIKLVAIQSDNSPVCPLLWIFSGSGNGLWYPINSIAGIFTSVA